MPGWWPNAPRAASPPPVIDLRTLTCRTSTARSVSSSSANPPSASPDDQLADPVPHPCRDLTQLSEDLPAVARSQEPAWIAQYLNRRDRGPGARLLPSAKLNAPVIWSRHGTECGQLEWPDPCVVPTAGTAERPANGTSTRFVLPVPEGCDTCSPRSAWLLGSRSTGSGCRQAKDRVTQLLAETARSHGPQWPPVERVRLQRRFVGVVETDVRVPQPHHFMCSITVIPPIRSAPAQT